MIDMQLMHMALAGIGIASAAAVLVAVMILTVAAGLRNRRGHQAGTPVNPSVSGHSFGPARAGPAVARAG